MNKLIPAFLTKLDSWLLLNYPRVWATRVHYLIFVLLVGSLLAGSAAFVPNTSIYNILNQDHERFDNVYSKIVLVIISLPILAFWLMRFRSKHSIFTWKEFLLSVPFGIFICFPFYFFINIYSVVYQIRMSNLLDKKGVEKDLVLTKVLEEIIESKIVKFEDIKVHNYEFKKEEAERIYKNIDYFRQLGDINLGGYTGPEEEEMDTMTTEQRMAKHQEIDSLYKVFHFNAVKKCMTVPDSFKSLYLKLSDNQTRIPKLEDDFLEKYLKTISPTSKYLIEKYKLEDTIASKGSFYLYPSNISLLPHHLSKYFGIQQSSFLKRFIQPDGFNFSLKDDEYFYEDDYKDRQFSVTQNRIDELLLDIENFKQRNYFLGDLLLTVIILYFPFMLLSSIVHFRRNDILFAILSFIVPLSLNGVLGEVLGNESRFNAINRIIAFQFIVIQLVILYLYFRKKQTQIRFASVFLPLALMASLICIPFIDQMLLEIQLKHMADKDPNFIPTNYLLELYLAFTILIFPLILMLYHRLAHLPKKQ